MYLWWGRSFVEFPEMPRPTASVKSIGRVETNVEMATVVRCEVDLMFDLKATITWATTSIATKIMRTREKRRELVGLVDDPTTLSLFVFSLSRWSYSEGDESSVVPATCRRCKGIIGRSQWLMDWITRIWSAPFKYDYVQRKRDNDVIRMAVI